NIYPNPTTNFINFTEKISNTKLSIYNTTGEMLFEEKAFSGTQLDISFLEKGIYFLKLEGELSGFIRLVKL
ncbi:MAG: T9SS type A sorting domain-containing protein, partial [Chitinophagales bacterium]